MPEKSKMENRVIAAEDIELRGTLDGEQRFVEGVGVVYNREVELWPGFYEMIRAGALTQSLNSGDEIKSFFNHDPNFVLATTKSDPPLELADEPQGLRFKAPIPPTSYGHDLEANLKRRNVRGASFSFIIDSRSDNDKGDIITCDEKGNYHREIIRAKIFEVGPVTDPAYKATKVKLRDAAELMAEAEARCTIDKETIDRREIAKEGKDKSSLLDIKIKTVSLLERGM